MPPLITCVLVLEMKSSKDCLQGIAKLDYLMKVSMFQIYKDHNLKRSKK